MDWRVNGQLISWIQNLGVLKYVSTWAQSSTGTTGEAAYNFAKIVEDASIVPIQALRVQALKASARDD